MSSSVMRIAIALVLMAHGLGHSLGMLPTFGIRLSKTHSSASWLLSNPLGDSATRVIGLAVWSVSLIGFVLAGLGCLGWLVPRDSWQPLAIAAAIASLAAIALFWGGLPFLFPNKVGALTVNLAVLVSLLWLHWPTAIVGR